MALVSLEPRTSSSDLYDVGVVDRRQIGLDEGVGWCPA